MPTNVGLRNTNSPENEDGFGIWDNVTVAQIAYAKVRGGEIFRFDCAADDQGYGDIVVTIDNSSDNFRFTLVRDNDVVDVKGVDDWINR